MTKLSPDNPVEKKFDAEAFSMNLARALQSGGNALAAYLKGRESGDVKDHPPAELAEVIKTLTSVAEYWYADERARDLQTKIAKGYLFFFNDTAPPDVYTLSLHDALPAARSAE